MPAMDYAKIADLYDIYAQSDIDVPFFIQEAQGCRHVLELTSGTGRLSLPLIEAGIPLSCLDSSPEMLAILHKRLQDKGLSAPVHEMDVSSFSIPARFDLIIFPFNSFTELVHLPEQQAALRAIRDHLVDKGRFICTFHNPAIRLKSIDGQIHLRARFLLPDNAGTLILFTVETYDPETNQVSGAQFYEIYNRDGIMESKRFVGIRYYLHSQETFGACARAAGLAVERLYGDYVRAEFHPDKSPYMIWTMIKA
jgi:SAM-dependent methyltransferase